MRKGKCISQHRVLIVDQWTPLGAFVTCLTCGMEFHSTRTQLEDEFVGFEHVSHNGPSADRWVFIWRKELEYR